MKKMSGFAEALDNNAHMTHKSMPAAMDHMHMHAQDGKAVVEHHGPQHEVLAEHQFHPTEHEKMGKHIMSHLGLDEKEPEGEAEHEGAAYEKDSAGDGSAAGAAY